MSVKWPPLFLSIIIASIAASPTPFNPPNPNRICPCLFTEKPFKDSLISGPNTLIPILLHSSMKNVILSILPA